MSASHAISPEEKKNMTKIQIISPQVESEKQPKYFTIIQLQEDPTSRLPEQALSCITADISRNDPI